MRSVRRCVVPVAISAAVVAQAVCGDGGGTGPRPGVAVTVTRAGGDVSCGHSETGMAAYCWGANQVGQLGDGTLADRYLPTPVSGSRIYLFPAPGEHTCAPEARGLRGA
ncbi:MAG TPA: RCC1 domain-containing protein [Gemmatimonadales bacterium]|nr:RCC1 domain-containing protein [Gemmatimonadales bacterium]